MTVLGGGAIAVEMAHYLHALGVEVTVIQRSSHVLSDMDSDLAQEVERAFRERGMEVVCGTRVLQVAMAEGKKSVTFEHEGQERQVVSDEILLATGRRPSIEALQLDALGWKFEGSIPVQSTQMTALPGIFAAGDVCSPLEVVHLAIEQGEIAAHNAAVWLKRLDAPMREIDYRLQLYGVFCDPEVASVGKSDQELKESGEAYSVAHARFDDHGKSMVMGETHGLVKLMADPVSRQLLGGAVVGPHAVELIHEIVVAMHFSATAGDLLRIPHYHPTLSEIWTYPAEELAGE